MVSRRDVIRISPLIFIAETRKLQDVSCSPSGLISRSGALYKIHGKSWHN